MTGNELLGKRYYVSLNEQNNTFTQSTFHLEIYLHHVTHLFSSNELRRERTDTSIMNSKSEQLLFESTRVKPYNAVQILQRNNQH